MKEVAGYYDGNSVQLLEAAPKTKQRVIVTFIEEDDVFDELPVGILSKYANPNKRHLEEGAFERAMVEKHSADKNNVALSFKKRIRSHFPIPERASLCAYHEI